MAADPNAPPVQADSQTKDTVNTTNIKVVGETPAFSTGLAQQGLARQAIMMGDNAIADQQDVRAMVKASLNVHLTTMNAMAARAGGFVLDSSDSAKLSTQLADLNSTLASNQQSAKIANSTPVETGLAGQVANLGTVLNAQAQATNQILAQTAQALSAVLAFMEAQSNGPSPVLREVGIPVPGVPAGK